MMTPVSGFNGPGAHMPMAPKRVGGDASEKRPRIAVETASRPFDGAPVVSIGVLYRTRISPLASTRPATTFDPPISTPTTTLDSAFISCNALNLGRQSQCAQSTGAAATPTCLSAPP